MTKLRQLATQRPAAEQGTEVGQARAAGLFKRAMAAQEAALHPDHPDLAETRALLEKLPPALQ